MPTVRVLAGATALAFLAGPYRDLYLQDAQATVFQDPAWLGAWAEQLPPAAVPLLLVAEDRLGQGAAALALVHDATGPRERVYPLSAPMADYVRVTGPHADSAPIAASLVVALRRFAGDHIDIAMSDVPAACALGRTLTEAAGRQGWLHTTGHCAAIDLPVDYAAMSASTRRSHRRRQRHWDRLAESRSVVYCRTRTTAELLDTYSVLADLHERRWAGASPPPHAAHPGLADSWRPVLGRCGAGMFSIATLSVDGTVVATQLCVMRRATCYSLVPAMDPEFQALAPGHALLRLLTRDLYDQRFRVLDLGRTVEGQRYKHQYLPRWMSTVSVGCVPTSPLDRSIRRSEALRTVASTVPGPPC
ncbi:GNAT family N-acetyltransferase [Streptomyces xanthochromogenes]|uniref:GNAT family N-acetyltransferase n=1 Tax=Streptomyces xanthochromogenes TaxID=67384 RepID=UPI0037B99A0E